MKPFDQETYALLKRFSAESFKKYSSYSHAAGFYESVLARAMSELPKKQRLQYLEFLNKAIQEVSKDQG